MFKFWIDCSSTLNKFIFNNLESWWYCSDCSQMSRGKMSFSLVFAAASWTGFFVKSSFCVSPQEYLWSHHCPLLYGGIRYIVINTVTTFCKLSLAVVVPFPYSLHSLMHWGGESMEKLSLKLNFRHSGSLDCELRHFGFYFFHSVVLFEQIF